MLFEPSGMPGRGSYRDGRGNAADARRKITRFGTGGATRGGFREHAGVRCVPSTRCARLVARLLDLARRSSRSRSPGHEPGLLARPSGVPASPARDARRCRGAFRTTRSGHASHQPRAGSGSRAPLAHLEQGNVDGPNGERSGRSRGPVPRGPGPFRLRSSRDAGPRSPPAVSRSPLRSCPSRSDPHTTLVLPHRLREPGPRSAALSSGEGEVARVSAGSLAPCQPVPEKEFPCQTRNEVVTFHIPRPTTAPRSGVG